MYAHSILNELGQADDDHLRRFLVPKEQWKPLIEARVQHGLIEPDDRLRTYGARSLRDALPDLWYDDNMTPLSWRSSDLDPVGVLVALRPFFWAGIKQSLDLAEGIWKLSTEERYPHELLSARLGEAFA